MPRPAEVLAPTESPLLLSRPPQHTLLELADAAGQRASATVRLRRAE